MKYLISVGVFLVISFILNISYHFLWCNNIVLILLKKGYLDNPFFYIFVVRIFYMNSIATLSGSMCTFYF